MLIGVADPFSVMGRDGPLMQGPLWNRPVLSQPEISSTIPIYHKYSNSMYYVHIMYILFQANMIITSFFCIKNVFDFSGNSRRFMNKTPSGEKHGAPPRPAGVRPVKPGYVEDWGDSSSMSLSKAIGSTSSFAI